MKRRPDWQAFDARRRSAFSSDRTGLAGRRIAIPLPNATSPQFAARPVQTSRNRHRKDRVIPCAAMQRCFCFESCIGRKARLGGTPSPDTPAVQSQEPARNEATTVHPKHSSAWGFFCGTLTQFFDCALRFRTAAPSTHDPRRHDALDARRRAGADRAASAAAAPRAARMACGRRTSSSAWC